MERGRPRPPDYTRGFYSTQPQSQSGYHRIFEDIPQEFQRYIPDRWYPQHHTSENRYYQTDKATQTPDEFISGNGLSQYGLRNTIDLSQKSSLDGSRNRRSMSAPPEANVPDEDRANHRNANEGAKAPNVRHIPIFVEGRDRPVVNTEKAPSESFPETRSTPPRDNSTFFASHDMPSGFPQPTHFSKAFGDPFDMFNRRRNVSPFQQTARNFKPPPQAEPEPVKKRQNSAPQRPAESRKPRQETRADEHDAPQHQPPPPRQSQSPTPPPEQNKISNDPIVKIQAIQKDVLDLMTKVENFNGSKKDKDYIYLDEMLTRNLIKLDDIDTEGKENIRLARREAIKCIQKCIAVMEAKAESLAAMQQNPPENPPSEGSTEQATQLSKSSSSNRQSAYDNVDVEKENKEPGDRQNVENSASVVAMDVDPATSSQ